MTTLSISTRDITLLREVLDLARPDRTMPAQQATFRLLEVVRELVGADEASLQDLDSLTFDRTYAQYVSDDGSGVATREELAQQDEEEPGTQLVLAQWWTSECSLIERTGRPVATTVLSHRSARQWAQEPINIEYFRTADEAILGYPVTTFRSLRILLPRESGPGFGEREKVILELLLPHLQPLLAATVEESRHTAPDPLSLTERQREILGLVRLGMPNKRIGRILGISEATVRKHLENVFVRLGVESRTAAAAVAFGEEPAPELHAVESAS